MGPRVTDAGGELLRPVKQAWSGIDAGKAHHHIVVIDRDGTRLLSRRVPNHEPDRIKLIDIVRAHTSELTWAVDLPDGPASLVIALLLERDQHLLYLPGVAVIADQARMRRDLRVMHLTEPEIIELRMLTAPT